MRRQPRPKKPRRHWSSTSAAIARLREREDIPALLRRSGTLIARGNGRSYGDAALNPRLTVSMLAMDRMEAFDPQRGLLVCEAGVLLADILDTFVPRGWFPPVVPGTKFVTVGGMIAADVHGKNHHRDGSFGVFVESIVLATADGRLRVCSRSQQPELFHATIGGMGLTGIIVSASFRLRRIETSTHRCGGRIYLAKDACCASDRLRQGYPQSEAFQRSRKAAANSSAKFASALSKRLAL